MDAARWQQVKDVFSAALERDAATRGTFLDEACRGDTGLRAEVDSLLRSHETPDGFIEQPAARRALGLGAEREPGSWIGRRVGDYRVVAEVGRGGMSEVYKAVRDDDEYQKEVAVKVLRRGYDTRSFLKRFKVEIQLLAMLDHPNIARLLDAGSTEEGLPYLVMDYIRGRPIDDYCSFHRLSIAARLKLFHDLCSAVQYVHQHLMVHGDLKCSNILVAENGVVKLLDFGIARLLNPAPGLKLPDPKLTGLLALTPEFASPEQVRGGPITTSSDVYSLGVVLYRLLTGVLPYRLNGEFSYELATRILQKEPPQPSVAAKANENGETLGFGRQLRGDLDNIILRALEKDPALRYSSVERLDDDIRRHLEGFPVAARSTGALYRLTKFAGRHKAGIAAVAVLVLTLIGGIVATSWQAHIAGLERQRAQQHFDEVRKLANVFIFDVHSAIADLPGSTPARKMLVENSLKYLESLAAESGGEPTLQRELASAYEKVADVQGGFRTSNLGDTNGAASSYRKALSIRQSLLTANPADREIKRELLRNYGKLSELLAGEGDTLAAIETSRRAAKLAQELFAAPGATVEDRRNFGTAYLSLGWQLARSPQVGDGLLFMKQGAAVYESLLAAEPDDLATRRLMAVTYSRIGDALLESTQQNAEALRMNEKSYELARDMAAADPRSTRLNKIMGYALLGIGTALTRLDKPQEALEKRLLAVKVLRASLDADARDEVARYDAAFAIGEAGISYIALRDLRAADRQFAEALAILSQSAGITEATLNDSKVLLGTEYFRLGEINALRAADPAATPSERAQHCTEARRWFELSRPILSEAERIEQWRPNVAGMPARIATELAACSSALTAAAPTPR